jgi:protein O-GlcNAc transferase
LFLDTLPLNGHTASVDPSWAGVSVLTCKGTSFAGRVAASVLVAAELPELIIESHQAYEAGARALAHDPSALSEIDAQAFTRNLEAAYVVIWERQQRGEALCRCAVEQAMAPDSS